MADTIQLYPCVQKASSTGTGSIRSYPSQCPFCLSDVQQIPIMGIFRSDAKSLSVVMKCGSQRCYSLYMAEYKKDSTGQFYEFDKLGRFKVEERKFVNIISDISPSFESIYNQSYASEQLGYTDICGIGFRKAFEFLIKDYLIKNLPDKVASIKKMPLAQCIEKMMPGQQLKEVAKRAAWLGNDETHYERIWADKDIDDLKKLIDLSIHWIIHEELTQQYITSMDKTSPVPEKK